MKTATYYLLAQLLAGLLIAAAFQPAYAYSQGQEAEEPTVADLMTYLLGEGIQYHYTGIE